MDQAIHSVCRLPLLLLSLSIAPTFADEAPAVDLSRIDRSIVKEPVYKQAPHYTLLVFGKQAEQRSWLVMDGDETLYIDRNGNGDLTEPEDRIERNDRETGRIKFNPESAYSFMNVYPLGVVAGRKLTFQFWVRKPDFVPKEERDRNLLRERQARNWQNGTLSWYGNDHRQPVGIPILLTATRDEAQVTPFDGPAMFSLSPVPRIRFLPWPQASTFGIQIGTPARHAAGSEDDVLCAIHQSEFPKDVHPTAVLEFASAQPGGQPIVQTVKLGKRQGAHFSAPVSVPRGVAAGSARVTVSYPESVDRPVPPATFDVAVGNDPEGKRPEVAFIMFHDPDQQIGLDEAMTALRVKRLTVSARTSPEREEALVVTQGDKTGIRIVLNRSPEVLEIATALAENSPFAQTLKRCESRLEITIPGKPNQPDQKLVQIIYAALQAETDGFLFTPADQQLVPPKPLPDNGR